jgi:hypothetical protein
MRFYNCVASNISQRSLHHIVAQTDPSSVQIHWILFSTCRGHQNRHTEHLVELVEDFRSVRLLLMESRSFRIFVIPFYFQSVPVH